MPQNETNELLKQILGVLTELKNITLKPITSQVGPALASLSPQLPTVEKPKERTEPPSLIQKELLTRYLTRDFDAEIVPMDGTTYNFRVIVPDKYNTIPLSQRGPKVRDIRPKVLHYADGDRAVEEWLNLIYKSFSPDQQATMILER